MIIKNTLRNNKIVLSLFFLITLTGNAQIGIGTITPNASSILDVTSTTKGLLTPRMTTAQRNAITTPADGLMVYDTDLKLLYYYSSGSSSWLPLNNALSAGRTNFKRIKSAADLATELTNGSGSKYLLNTNTFYEINGSITLSFPIDLNNAYVVGLDANEDRLVRATGNLFDGSTGGTIKNVTLIATSGKVFNISGIASENLLIRDTIIASSSSVGSITGLGLVFVSVVQYVGNTTGIVYDSISKLLISNAAWFSSNQGTFEKMQGTFGLIQKQGGFCEVLAGRIGVDVSANPTITDDAVMESVVFTGVNTAGYVNKYTTGSYTGYNFNNSWSVRCAGLPNETDANAAGDFAMDYTVGSGTGVAFTNNLNPSNIVKVGDGSTIFTATNLFRFSTDASTNRLKYLGKKKRIFQISGSISFQIPASGTYIIYIAKNGTVLSQFKIYGRGTVTNDIIVLPINATTELLTNDYLEIHAQRYSGSNGNIVVPNMSITIR